MIKNMFSKEFYEKILNKAIHEAGPKYILGLEKDAPNLEIKELIFTFDILGTCYLVSVINNIVPLYKNIF